MKLNKTNDILLGKLLDISKGKNTFIANVSNSSSVQNLHSCLVPTHHHKVKSLHYLAKKHEFDRIEKENLKLMNRIANQGSTLSLKKIGQEYEERK